MSLSVYHFSGKFSTGGTSGRKCSHTIREGAACLLLLQNGGLLSVKYTEIAEYLTISYRHLMHLISTMCEEQILECVPKGVRILDWDKVRELAEDIREEE